MVSMDMTFLHHQISFVDQIPQLLRQKVSFFISDLVDYPICSFQTDLSEYSYFDSTKLKLFAGPNLWKYTNLLPDLRSHSQKIISHSRTRSIKLNLEDIRSLNDLMHIPISHRKSKLKRLQKPPLSPIHHHQLRLSRKMRPLTDLFSLHYFPDYHFQYQSNLTEYSSIHEDDDHYQFDQLHYDFIRPIHYEKIELDKLSGRIDAKKLQTQLNDQYNEQLTTTSHPISLSSLCLQLVDQGILSSEKDQLISAFYCLLNNCNKNHLYLKNTSQHDDLIIQTQRPTST